MANSKPKNNTIKTQFNNKPVEVYENDILKYVDDYINNELDNPNDIYNNSSLFNGMIKHIYINVFKPKSKKDINNYNGIAKNTNINLEDIELLDNIFNIYLMLCYKYKKRPTILNFSILIGIENKTLLTWKNGEYRATHSATIQKWYDECESTLLDGAIENNSIGCIFALKANYGYTETPQRLIVEQNAPSLSKQELEKLYQNNELIEVNPDF